MSFNPYPRKQGQKVIFSRKVNKDSHPPLTFNSNMATPQKNLGIILDNRLFERHLRLVFNEINKTIAMLCKLQCFIPRSPLPTV